MTKPTWYAFDMPTVADGVARLVDFAGTLDTKDFDFEITDSTALRADFAAVGWDIGEAVVEVSEDERLSA